MMRNFRIKEMLQIRYVLRNCVSKHLEEWHKMSECPNLLLFIEYFREIFSIFSMWKYTINMKRKRQ